jgi:hypothetical protein
VVAAGDALRELAQIGAVQQFAKLRLADQDDLQQLLRGVSRLVSRRTCSSTSKDRFCASSTMTMMRLPSACAHSAAADSAHPPSA